jgi:hypothetical protein
MKGRASISDFLCKGPWSSFGIPLYVPKDFHEELRIIVAKLRMPAKTRKAAAKKE